MNTMPGLDILQQWMQSARGAMPGLPAWAAPTLDPEEIGKRIEELRTVQFWLEQNAKLIAGSIQALEVQRMTLTTLQSLKVPLADIGAAFRMPEPAAAPEPDPAPNPAPAAAAAAEPPRAAAPAAESPSGEAPGAEAAARSPLADPMQWWGTLTQQFAHLATQAAQESAAAAQAAAAAASSTVARAVAPQPAAAAEAPPPPRAARPAAKKAGGAAPAKKAAKGAPAAPTTRRKTAAAPSAPKGRR